MKGEQIMKKVNLREYAAICRAASRRRNFIARLKVRNVEVEGNDNELVKLVAKELKEKGDFFETICCTDPNVGATEFGQWAERVWKRKKRNLAEIRNGNWFVSGRWVFANNPEKPEEVLEKEQAFFMNSMLKLMKDLKEEAEEIGVKVRQGMTLDSLYFSI